MENRTLNFQSRGLELMSVAGRYAQRGEVYMADVMLAVVDTTSPPITILCREDSSTHELISLGDTLKYTKEFESSTFRKTCTSKGMQKWSGKILQQRNGKEYEYGFSVEYEVY